MSWLFGFKPRAEPTLVGGAPDDPSRNLSVMLVRKIRHFWDAYAYVLDGSPLTVLDQERLA